MSEILQLFQYDFFINAVIAALLTSITCGIIGTYIVTRRIVFISGGITHASFGGIGIGYYLGINPVFGAAVFGVLSALGIEYLSKKTKVREDSAIAMLWSFGMALGIIFIFLTPGYAPNMTTYLFGSILTVSAEDLWFMGIFTVLLMLFFALFYRTIMLIAFDEEYARTHRMPVNTISYILIAYVALTVVVNIRVVGIILVLSLLTIPQTIANLFTDKFTKIIFLSIAIAFFGALTGLVSAYLFNIPSGASIIFVLVLMFGFARTIVAIFNRNRKNYLNKH